MPPSTGTRRFWRARCFHIQRDQFSREETDKQTDRQTDRILDTPTVGASTALPSRWHYGSRGPALSPCPPNPNPHNPPTIIMHGAMAPATLCLGGLGPCLGHGSRFFRLSPTPGPNFKFIAVSSSSQRVLQLWSNRTWSTWLLFWSRKWPSEASNHHFFPLRGLDAALVKAAPYGARGNLH